MIPFDTLSDAVAMHLSRIPCSNNVVVLLLLTAMLTNLIPGPRLSHPEGVSKVYQKGGPPQKRIESLSANWSDPTSVSESIKIHIAQSPQSTPSPPAPPEPLSGWGTPARGGGPGRANRIKSVSVSGLHYSALEANG